MIEIGVLGPLRILVGHKEIDLSTAMLQRMLIILLAAKGEAVNVGAIADALWEGRPPRTARKTVQVYVHRLRRVVGPDLPLSHRASGYVLQLGTEELDAYRFERTLAQAKEAVESGDSVRAWRLFNEAHGLWRGEPYADIHDLPWVEAERRRLVDLRLGAFEAHTAIGLELGRHDELATDLAPVILEHPFREDLRAQLMLAMYRAGRRTEALELYRATHQMLADELGVEPMPRLQRLHEQILRNDVALMPRPRRRFLPRDVAGFVGRQRDFEWMDVQASSHPCSPVIITAIAGAAGIGKTALAVRWAHTVAGRFADGQLYVNLRGYDTRSPLQPLEALAHLLRCLEVPAEKLPPDAEAAAALFRSMVAGKRMLILLDNARTAEQVRPLLPGDPGNLVVVTSRDRLSGLIAIEGAHRLTLGLLDVDEAVELLRWFLGDARVDCAIEDVHRLVEVCGRLPLALRIGATHLADRPEIAVGTYVEELAASDRISTLSLDEDAHRGLKAVLDQSYHALSADLQLAFSHLGIFPGPDFSADLAAALLDCSTERASSILDQLASGHLVEQQSPGRFALHDLVREYARSAFIGSGVPSSAPLGRLFDMLRHLAEEAHSRIDYQTLRTDTNAAELTPARAMAWLDQEKANLIAAVTSAAENGFVDSAHAIAKALWMFFYYAGHTADWIATFEIAYEASADKGDPRVRYYLLNALGSAYVIAGHYDKAMRAHRACITAREAIGDDDGVARSRSNLAMSLYQLGRYEEALSELKGALTVYQDNGDRAMEAFLLGANIPDVLTELGRYEEAIEHLQRSLAIRADGENPFARAGALVALGSVYVRMGRASLAVEPLEDAIELCRRVENRRVEVVAKVTLAEAYLDLGSLELAEELATRTLEASRQMGLSAVECENLHLLGRIYLSAGVPDEARRAFDETLRLATEHKLEPLRGLALAGIGATLREVNPGEARRKLRSALDILERASHREVARIRRELESLE